MSTWVLVAGDFTRHGGMDRANLELASFLAGRGDAVHLVAHGVAPDLAARPGVTVHAVARPLGSHRLGALMLERRGRAVAAEISRHDPRARVVVNGGNCAWGDVNWVHMVHNACATVDGGAPLAVRAKNRLAERMDRRDERRRELVERVGVEESRVRVVYLGTDPEVFRPISPEERAASRAALGIDDGRPVVLFVGMLGHDRKKGFDTLLAAWSRLRADGLERAELLAVGGGDLDLWRREVERSGVTGRVRLLGTTERPDAIMAASDVFVAPTRYDAYGLAVHEALCRGVPALVTRAAGIAERYPAALEELLVSDAESADELARRLATCLADGARLRDAVAAFGAELRRRSWTDMAREIASLVEAAA